MDLYQVRYFLTLAQTLNFTRAAEECNVTQPALSRAIQKLEEELGGPLFNRERGLTHLTPLGRMMLPHLEQTLAAANTAKQLADGIRKAELTPLGLGVTGSLSLSHLLEMMEQLNRSLNGFELNLSSGSTAALIEEAERGDLEVVIIDAGDGLPERLQGWRLFREDFLVVCRADHPFAGLGAVPLRDLDGCVWIDRAGCPTAVRFQQACVAAGVRPSLRHRAANEEHLQRLAQAGLGCGLTPANVPLLDGLITRPLDGVDLSRTVLVGAMAGRRRSLAAEAFLRAVRARSWRIGAGAGAGAGESGLSP